MNPEGSLHAGQRDRTVHPSLPSPNLTRFLKYLAWFESAQGFLLERSGADVPLFPSALPYPEALKPEGVSGRLGADSWSKVFVNTLVAWSNFVVLGCPRDDSGVLEPRVAYRSVEGIRPFADKLLGEVVEFMSPELVEGAFFSTGKRKDLEEYIASCTDAHYGQFVKVGSGSLSTALPVVAERVAIPEVAGKVDPCSCLDPARAQVVAHLEDLRLPEVAWKEVGPACHRVAKEEETPLLRKLWKANMVSFVPEAELPRDLSGKLRLGGLFAVQKNEAEDRLIFDRRPENATMRKLDWATLPNGACFCRMLLEDNEYLRGSGDDLRNYYYTLALPANWLRFNAFGRRVHRDLLVEAGLDERVPHRACLRVLGMGDVNGCDVAQAVHEAVLRHGGVLDPKSTLVYGEPVPVGRLWEGIYLDDLLIAYRHELEYKVALDGSFIPPTPSDQDPDVLEVKAAEAAYEEAGFDRALHKAFRCEVEFKAWGAEINGVLGKVGAPLETRRQVWSILRRIVELGFSTKVILQKVLGLACFVFQFRRELYGLQHHVFKFLQGLSEDKWHRLPHHILDELRSIALHLPFAYWNMRRSIEPNLIATDATPIGGGATIADIPPAVARELWRRSEQRGSAVRLDREHDFLCEAETPSEPSRYASSLAECLQWRVLASYTFRQTSHINLQELRAFKRELCRVCAQYSSKGRVQLFINDSRVVIGAVAKGRSSSFKINGMLRTLIPHLLFGDVCVALLWTETSSNPADHPSRSQPLPLPRTPTNWMRDLGLGAGQCWGIEIFAGTARLTRAHVERGCDMFAPIEIELGCDALGPELDHLICQGHVRWIWLSPPCCSFSPLRNLDRSGPLRPRGHPEGDENRPEVSVGNQLWRRSVFLAHLITKRGGFFGLEHPASSRAWALDETQLLLAREDVHLVTVNWCAYSDHERVGLPTKKPTRLCFNLPWLAGELCTAFVDNGFFSASFSDGFPPYPPDRLLDAVSGASSGATQLAQWVGWVVQATAGLSRTL